MLGEKSSFFSLSLVVRQFGREVLHSRPGFPKVSYLHKKQKHLQNPLPLQFSYTTWEAACVNPVFHLEGEPPLRCQLLEQAVCTYGHAKEALGRVATLYCSLQCGTANTKHLCKEINEFRAGSKLHLEVGKPSTQS